MTKGRVFSAIYIGNIADLDGAGTHESPDDGSDLLLKRAFNSRDMPAMAIRKLYPGLIGAQPGYRIGSAKAPVIAQQWEGRFTSRLTYDCAATGGLFRQNALVRVIRLDNGDIYIPTDRATGEALAARDTNAQGGTDRSLVQIELLRLRPSRGGQVESAGEGPALLSGFVSGTQIATPAGGVPVESLRAGDLVETIDHGPRALKWVGRHDLSVDDIKSAPQMRPIMIAAGALGRNMPQRDLLVSPLLRVRLRSKIARNLFDSLQVLVPAKQLCQISGIDIRKQPLPVSYVHLMFDQHELVTVNGAVTESFFPGRKTLRMIDDAQQHDLIALYPHLQEEGAGFAPARPILSGQQSRKLVVRHIDKQRPLVS